MIATGTGTMLRDRIRRRLADVGDSPDYRALAAELLATRVADAALARRLIEQALVVEDRRRGWQAGGPGIVAEAPTLPGVYIMRDMDGTVLYVGKAANLKSRLRSYFAPSRWRRLPSGIPRTARVEWHVVGSELEALLREAELIDTLRPRLNVQARVRRSRLRRHPSAVRDVIVVLPSIEPESVELVCARVDGAGHRRRVARAGRSLRADAYRIARFFRAVTRVPEPPLLGLIVFSWLADRGREASRIDPHACESPRDLSARLAALLRDRDLFAGRIDQRATRLNEAG